MDQGLTLGQRRELIAAARVALTGIGDWLWQAAGSTPGGGGGGLAELLGEVDGLGVACDAARVAVVGEAVERGEPGAGRVAMTVVGWVRQHAPSTRAGGARQLVEVAAAFGKPVNAAVKQAVEVGVLPVRSAAVVVAEADRLRPVLAPGAEPHVVAGLVQMAAEHGPRGCRMVRPALLARYGREGQLQVEQDVARRFVALSQPVQDGTGVTEYRLVLDPEGSAVLEAALGPLSAPRPAQVVRDLRGSDRRRGEALVALVRRAVAAGRGVGPVAKAQLVVTMDWAALSADVTRALTPGGGNGGVGVGVGGAGVGGVGVRGVGVGGAGAGGARVVRAGVSVGGSGAGVFLAPETVRRLACDALVVPVVLGSAGEVVDQGRAVRLFTAAQVRRLWLRDGGCTFPGCSVPAQWADAHHLVHWADFGATDVANAALLCGHHHTVVHSRRLAGAVMTGGGDHDGQPSAGASDSGSAGGERVEWDLTPGSYDQLLARRAAQEPA